LGQLRVVALISWVDEPEMMPTRCRLPTRRATSSEVAPISRAATEKRWKASTLSLTATPVSSASRYSRS
jgi:hypothetical protein